MVLELGMLLMTTLAAYGALGALFALVCLVSGVERLAPEPAPLSGPARVLIVPGLILLWPRLVLKWIGLPRPRT
jgi:hypothetical protein